MRRRGRSQLQHSIVSPIGVNVKLSYPGDGLQTSDNALSRGPAQACQRFSQAFRVVSLLSFKKSELKWLKWQIKQRGRKHNGGQC
jgi:hypothetical protein